MWCGRNKVQEDLHLGQLGVFFPVQGEGGTGEGGTVLKGEGLAHQVLPVLQADFWQHGPPDAAGDHGKTGGNVVDLDGGGGFRNVLFQFPSLDPGHERLVGLPVDVGEPGQGHALIGPAGYRIDPFPGQQQAFSRPGKMPPEHRHGQPVFLELGEQVQALASGYVDADFRIVGHVLLQEGGRVYRA